METGTLTCTNSHFVCLCYVASYCQYIDCTTCNSNIKKIESSYQNVYTHIHCTRDESSSVAFNAAHEYNLTCTHTMH